MNASVAEGRGAGLRSGSAWRRRVLLAGFAVALGLTGGGVGCDQSEGSGELWGTLRWPECEGFDGDVEMALDFFALEPFGPNSGILRLQQGGRGAELGDGLLFAIYDLDAAQRARGTEIAVTPVDPARSEAGDYLACESPEADQPSWCPLLRAELNFPSRCPRDATTPALQGTLVFTYLGLQDNEQTAGRFDLTVIDRHSGEQLGDLHGRFDFAVRRGHPYRRFSP